VGTPEWLPVVTQIGLGSVCVRSRGIGNETLSEFFHILHLEGRIGVSPMPWVRAQIEQQILNYRDEQQAQTAKAGAC